VFLLKYNKINHITGNLVCSYCFSKILDEEDTSPPVSSFFDGMSADIRIKQKSWRLKREMVKKNAKPENMKF